jgi:nitrate reductase cytochrome c-type subunit
MKLIQILVLSLLLISCKNNKKVEHVAADTNESFENIGLEYALATKKVLGLNLIEAIQKNGTIDALSFCSINAIPLTDSMSTKHNAIIKRVSDKNRNPENKANTEEIKYIEFYKTQIATNQEIKPTTINKDNKIHFYYPITTNAMCLQCHGTTENIASEVRSKILKLYPNDMAIGYSENEVRGIWSIQFEKK